MPEALDHVFQRLVAKRPEDRYQTMEKVIEQLQAFVVDSEGTDHPLAKLRRPEGALEGHGQTLARSRDDTSVVQPSSPQASISAALSVTWERMPRRAKALICTAVLAMIVLASAYVGNRWANRRPDTSANLAADVDRPGMPPPAADGSTQGHDQNGSQAASPSLTDAVPPPSEDVDWAVAQRVLSLGGIVTLIVDFQTRAVPGEKDLPAKSFVVREIELKSSELTNGDLSQVGQLACLKSLHLSDCSAVTDDGLSSLENVTTLDKFMVVNAPITTPGLAHLIRNQGLKHLALNHTRVDDQAIETIRNFQGLTGLHIVSPEFTGTGLSQLANLKELTYLGITGKVLANQSADAIAAFPKLVTLAIVEANDEALQQAAKLKGVTNLELGDAATSVTAQGLSALAAMPNLKTLKIFGITLTDADAEALGTISQLRELELVNQPLRASTLNKIHQALPLCHLVYDGTSLDGRNRSAAGKLGTV